MKINLRRSFVTMLILLMPLQSFLNIGQAGFSYSKDLTHNIVQVSAGTHPGIILWALVALCLFGMMLKGEEGFASLQVPSLWRRFWAFVLDFIFSVSILGSIFAFVPIFLEARRTEDFQWQFARNYSVPSDWLFLSLTLLMMVIIVLYFIYPLTKGKPTVGGYLLRLVTVEKGEAVVLPWPRATKRILWGLFGMCVWPFTIIKGRDKEGTTWYDRKSGLTVLRYSKGADEVKGMPLALYFVGAFAVCGLAYAYTQYLDSKPPAPHWRVFSYEGYGITLESPVPLPVDKAAYESTELEKAETKKLSFSSGTPHLYVSAESISYKGAVVSSALDDFRRSTLENFSKAGSMRDFKSEAQQTTCSGLPGVLITGTFLSEENNPMRLEILFLAGGSNSWLVDIRGYDKPEFKETAQRIIKSVKIQKF